MTNFEMKLLLLFEQRDDTQRIRFVVKLICCQVQNKMSLFVDFVIVSLSAIY